MRFPSRTRSRTEHTPEGLPATGTADADGGSCCAFDLVEDDEQSDDSRST